MRVDLEFVEARLAVGDDTRVLCGGAQRTCRDQLAWVDVVSTPWDQSKRLFLLAPNGWQVTRHDPVLMGTDALLSRLELAYPGFGPLGVIDVWQRTRHTRQQQRATRGRAKPQGAALAALKKMRTPALAVCASGHVNVLDGAALRV